MANAVIKSRQQTQNKGTISKIKPFDVFFRETGIC